MKPSRFFASLCLAWALAVNVPAIGADTVAKPPTLADTLAKTPPTQDEIFVTVSPEKVNLPKGAAPPTPGDTPSQIASAYGDIVQSFGAVTAIAPANITVVYSPPDTPNPYDGMPPSEVMKLLGATFTKDQWRALLSEQGVAYTSMTTDAQKALFESLFPDGHMVVIQDNPDGPNDPSTKQDLSGLQLTEASLHIGYIVSIALPVVAGKNDEHVFAGGPEPRGTPVRYFMTNAQSDNVDREFGGQVRKEVSNTLKPSALDVTAPEFKRLVSLDGIRTIDDLMLRISAALHREFYADPHYGVRTVTVLSAAKTASIGDILQALALCVGGTYRQVGPAIVLTNDLVGFGQKHALWKAFEEKAQAMLPHENNPLPSPQPTENNPYTVQDIPWGSDPLAFTSEQQKQYWTKWRSNPMQGGSVVMDLTIPFSELSPVQQETARMTQAANKRQHLQTTLEGGIMIQAEPVLEVSVRSLGGPVLIFSGVENLLPYPALTPDEQKAQQKHLEAMVSPWHREEKSGPKSPLRPIIESIARRAVRIAPKTAQEVKDAVSQMKILGFNELWLQITPNPDPIHDKEMIALVTQASQDAKVAGITLIPDIRLLCWGDEPAPSLADLTLLGMTPEQEAHAADFMRSDTVNTVTPFAPSVQRRLTALVRQVGAISDIGGMVWENLIPAGYETFVPDGSDQTSGDALGYAEAGRLASLRVNHVDPIDLYTNYYTDMRAHVDLPDYTDFNQDRTLYNNWRTLRAQTAIALARQLAAALPAMFQGKASHLPVLVPPANQSWGSIYGSWDDFQLSLPSEDFISPRGPDGQITEGAQAIEHVNSSLSYHLSEVYAADTADRTIRDVVKSSHANLVVDITAKPEMLKELAKNETQLSAIAK